MPSYAASDLNLSLTPQQVQALKRSYADFVHLMETKQTVPLDFVRNLQNQLADALTKLLAWQSLQRDTDLKRHQMVHLLHPENDILALPWHIAAFDNAFMHLSKGFDWDGQVNIFAPEKVLPLKILVVIATPEDLEEGERLDHETEVENIIDAFQSLIADAKVELDFANDGT